jgi:hypothetical protein
MGVAEALSGSEGLSAVLSVATANAAEMAAPTRRSQIPSMAELCGLGDELDFGF